MKISLLVIFASIIAFSAGAQKIHFTDTSNVWSELVPQYNAPNPWVFNYYTYSYSGRQTIDSVDYVQFTFGLVREDTTAKKVFLRSGDSELVLMDYNLHTGDTFVTPNYRLVVLHVDSTLINAVWHKVWCFPFYSGGWYAGTDTIKVIEGIGCIEHPTFMMNDYSGCVECCQPYMYCFSNKGTKPLVSPQIGWLDNTSSCITYSHLDVTQRSWGTGKIDVFPNPSASQITVSSPILINQLSITDVLGQIVYSELCFSKEQHVDISRLNSGVYYIKVNANPVTMFLKK